MHIQADIALSGPLRLACMQAHANLHHRTIRKGVRGDDALCRHCRRHGIGSAGKDHEESVALGVHDVPVPLPEHCTQDLAALREHTGVTIT